jgi:uncharacterized iron-regulated membrane protein
MDLSNLYLSAEDGRLISSNQPWHGTTADVFAQLQLPLHGGRILGMPGRIMMSLLGVVVVMLSVTGIVIWWRKRCSRVLAARREVLSGPTEVEAARPLKLSAQPPAHR